MKTCKETLLRKASDLTAHVAAVGLAVGELQHSDTSHGVDRQSEKTLIVQQAFSLCQWNGYALRMALRIAPGFGGVP